jgi:hypothetical protein
MLRDYEVKWVRIIKWNWGRSYCTLIHSFVLHRNIWNK